LSHPRLSPGITAKHTNRALDELTRVCKKHAATDFPDELRRHNRKTPRPVPNDQQMMRHICVAIAHSQGARSIQIARLIDTDVFAKAFCNFNIARLAKQDPSKLLKKYWPHLSHMRFRGEVRSMVKCAQIFEDIQGEHGSFAQLIKHHQIPQRIRTEKEFDRFWAGFDSLQQEMISRKMPFFRSMTSLLQLLLDLDFDSVKPDLIVMRLARRIGLTSKETGDRKMREVVQIIQRYCLNRPLRASAVDLMMLCLGGQTGSVALLSKRFCPPSDPCHNTLCSLGRKGICRSFTRL